MNAKVKKIIKPVLILGVIAAIGFFAINSMMKNAAAAAAAALQPPSTVTLLKGDLTNVISVNGTVFSKTSTNVYSTVSAQVKTVHVEVGDAVQEGDLLAELDSTELERSLVSAQASLSTNQATAQHNLEMAKKDLENYKTNNSDLDKNKTLIAAQDAVDAADRNLDSALVTVSRARKKLTDFREDNDITKDSDVEYGDALYDDYTKLKQAHQDAQQAVENASEALDRAQRDLELAKENNQTGTAESIDSYEDRVKSAELSSNFTTQQISIQKTREDIENCKITAPVSGIVTAVNVVEGASGTGLLFVIQDGDNLKIVANIKEYDIGSISLGDPVTIKSDAITDRQFEGILSRIAPTSTIAATGDIKMSSDAEYQSEITVTGEKDGLRIGMTTKLSIITEERRGIYSVPYEAVGQNEAGEMVIYVMETGEDGTTTAREIVVSVGMENDLFSEISSSQLEDGLEIYRDAAQGQSAYTMTQASMAAADGSKTNVRRALS